MNTALNTSDNLRPCCVRSAQYADNGFCGECGTPLIRCSAFKKCGGVVGRDGYCAKCVAVELTVKGSSIKSTSVGGNLTIPFQLGNRSSAGQPLFIKGVWFRRGYEDWKLVETASDRVDPGQSQGFTVSLEELDRAGSHSIEVVLAVGSRWEYREEVIAFQGQLQIEVEQKKDLNVQQHINYSGETPQTGATIYAPVRVVSENPSERSDSGHSSTIELVRARNYEKSFGFRGTADGMTIRRDAKFFWEGFPAGTCPPEGPVVNPENLLVFGRSKTRERGGSSDIQLVVVGPDRTVDVDATLEISRDQFHIWIENDRLMLRVNSENGVQVNERTYSKNAILDLQNGDRIHPLTHQAERLEIRVQFESHHESVSRVGFRYA